MLYTCKICQCVTTVKPSDIFILIPKAKLLSLLSVVQKEIEWKAWKQHVKLITVYFLVCHRLSGVCNQGASLEKGKAVILGNFQFLSPPFSWVPPRTFISPPHPNYRYSQASYRGIICHAWWVWAAKPGEALRDYIKQRGCLECGKLWWWQTGRCWENMAETTYTTYVLTVMTWWAELSAALLWRRHLVYFYLCFYL